MSLSRLITWSALIGGWSAFFGWLFAELAFGRWVNESVLLALLMTTLVTLAIGVGLSQVVGLVNLRWTTAIILRAGPGSLGGLIGGLVGGAIGNLLFFLFAQISFLGRLGPMLGWTLGWTCIGVCLGSAEGLYERSGSKLRNGLIGGALGGFFGGFCFFPLSQLLGNLSGRAVAFVLLGLFIGLFIGLVQVVLKDAWLTVAAGFRPGRQLILTQDESSLGTSEKANLIFIAYGAKGVEPMHVKLIRQPTGNFVLQDANSRTGTLLNGSPMRQPTVLHDGDQFQIGPNIIRFNERIRSAPSAKQAEKKLHTPTPAPVMTAVPPVSTKPIEGTCPVCEQYRATGIRGERQCKVCSSIF